MTSAIHEYTIYNGDGTARMNTDSAHVAEAHSRIGFRVTAETTATPAWRQ